MNVAAAGGQTALSGPEIWLIGAGLGALAGAAVAAAQIFPGRWHPAWAANLLDWFSCPFFAGLAAGVVLALKHIPPLAEARTLGFIVCLVTCGITAVLGASAVAYWSRNYHPGAATKFKRASQRSKSEKPAKSAERIEKLRYFFRPGENAENIATVGRSTSSPDGASTTQGQKAKLPPPRFPIDSPLARLPHYAGHPRRVLSEGNKLSNPGKRQ